MNKQTKKIDNVVLVSIKPIGAYIMASEQVFERSETIILKARGKNINKVVNLTEILKRKGLKLESIEIGTDTLKTDEGKEILVSKIEVTLKK